MFTITQALGLFFTGIFYMCYNLLLHHTVRCRCKLKNALFYLCRGMQAALARPRPHSWMVLSRHIHHPSSWETCSSSGLSPRSSPCGHPERLAGNLNTLSTNAGTLSVRHLKGCINGKKTTRKASCISIKNQTPSLTFYCEKAQRT